MVKILEGQVSNKLTFIEELDRRVIRGEKVRMLSCVCVCGKNVVVTLTVFRTGRRQSCGCQRGQGLKKEFPLGQTFNKLTVISEPLPKFTGKRNIRMAKCLCVCGNTLEVELYGLTKRNTPIGCRYCRGKLDFPRLKEVIGAFEYLEQIPKRGNNKMILVRCHCSRVVEQRLTDFLASRIKSCGCKTFKSVPEQEIRSFLKELGLKCHSSRSVIPPLELDMYLPKYKLAIEFNGVHWHSEKHKPNNYHLRKTEECLKLGILLLHIWEDDWRLKQTIIEGRLLNLLGMSRKGVFARKTKTSRVSTKVKNSFYESNHIQGSCSSSQDYGLLFEGELVGCMSFKRRAERGVWELVRYATSKSIVGGFSKLLKHFQRNNDWTELISFADRAWSKGAVYDKTGWVLDKILRPDYKYVINGTRHHKFGFRHAALAKKLKLYDPTKTEHQNMIDNRIYRIYDCGKVRYTLTNLQN